MSFDWNQYLTLAQELLGQKPLQLTASNLEARQRAAISRAYYAIHKLAEGHLLSQGAYNSTIGITRHGDVWNQFKSGPGQEHMEFGDGLERLYDYRKKADYTRTSDWLTALNVQYAMGLAKSLAKDLDEIKKLDAAK